jgi:hypothetical protein
MFTRWLAGTLLFALGFGSALLTRLPAADAASAEGVVEGSDLRYVDGTDALQLINPSGGKTDFLVALSRKPEAAKESGPQVSYVTGSASFSKKDLQSLAVYQVTPLIGWKSGAEKSGTAKGGAAKSGETRLGVFRCGRPYICVLPPPPPPIGHFYVVLKAGTSGRSH